MPMRYVVDAARNLGTAAVVAAVATLSQVAPDPAPPAPLAQAIPPGLSGSPIFSDWSVKLLAVGLAAVYVATKAGEAFVAFQKNKNAAEAGTVQGDLHDCIEREQDCNGRCTRLAADLATAYVHLGQKDQQIARDGEAMRMLAENNRLLVDQNMSLAMSLAAVNAERSRPAAPLTVKIDPSSGPVPVDQVESAEHDAPAPGGDADAAPL